jgi:hypothetical protein
MNVEHSASPSVPLFRGSAEQVAKLRKRLQEIFRDRSLALDVVAICIELGKGNSGDFNAEMAHFLRRYAASLKLENSWSEFPGIRFMSYFAVRSLPTWSLGAAVHIS